MEEVLTQESRQLVFLSLVFPLQYTMPGENHLLHNLFLQHIWYSEDIKSLGCQLQLVLTGIIPAKSEELEQIIMSVKDPAPLYLR